MMKRRRYINKERKEYEKYMDQIYRNQLAVNLS